MPSESPELKESLLYTKYSLFITIVSLPFSLMGYVLKDGSSFAVDMMAYGITGFFIGLLSLIICYRTWKKRREDKE